MNYFDSVLDSLNQQIAVIDSGGLIQWVNHPWKSFAEDNGGCPVDTWQATNYIDVCANSAAAGDADGKTALAGIEGVISGEQSVFYLEYPCHSPTEQRWFMMQIRPMRRDGPKHYVVSHQNITERKLAELKVQSLADIDGLTGLANRRKFDSFLDQEWRRAQRIGCPLSLAMLDIDFFKSFNDQYGHLAGDDCLRQVGAALKEFSRRPGDMAARYGGEEFALVFGNTRHGAASQLADRLCARIRELEIPHANATDAGLVTASVGVASCHVDAQSDATPKELIAAADKALYEAKKSGRNRVCVSPRAAAGSDLAPAIARISLDLR